MNIRRAFCSALVGAVFVAQPAKATRSMRIHLVIGAGITPQAGDLSYYAPWGNLAILHKDFRYSPGLSLLGRIEGDIDALRAPGPMAVRIARVP
jgi:hypothetical protein